MNFGGLPYKTKQFFFVLIKLSIVVGAFYFIYDKLMYNPEMSFIEFTQRLNQSKLISLTNISLLLVLTGCNWYFEILKWKLLVGHIHSITFKKALEQTLGALTASLFTPNRIGDYGAKALFFKPSFRKKIMLLNLTGNVIQMAVTTLFGVVGLYIMYSNYGLHISYFKLVKLLIVLSLIIGVSVLGVRHKKMNFKNRMIRKLKSFFNELSLSLLASALGLAILRYFVFSFQFYVLLILFGVSMTYVNAMTVITSMYIIASIIPSISIFDVVIKGSVAVYLFSLIGVEEYIILSIVTLMWVLNFMLPSILGSYVVLNFNLPKPKNVC